MVPLKTQIETLTGVPVTQSGLLPPFQASCAAAASAITQDDVDATERFFETLPAQLAKFFEHFDVLLSPVMPRAGALNSEFDYAETYRPERMPMLLENLKFTGPVNFANCPAMSVPLSWGGQGGLPIGSHFAGPVGAERMLYELAYELEQARPWSAIWAPISLKHIPVR